MQGGTSSSSFFGSLLEKVTGKLKGKLLEKVEESLPDLAKLATGRLGVAERLAESPVTAKLVAHAIGVGVEDLSPGEIHGVGRALAQLISPAGREVNLSKGETLSLLAELGEALLPPGPQIAVEALKGVFEASAETVSESPLKVEPHKSLSVTIDWAALPAFRSVRLRNAKEG